MDGKWAVIINGLVFRQSRWPATGLYWTGAVKGLGKGDIRTPSQVYGGANGGYFGDQYLGIRQLPLELVVHSDDPAAAVELASQVSAALKLNEDVSLSFVTPGGKRYFLNHVRVAQADAELVSDRIIDYTVQLVAGDPFFYDSWTGAGNSAVLNVLTPGGIPWGDDGIVWASDGIVWDNGESNTIVTNNGDVDSYGTILVQGAVTNPRFTNLTTGRTLSLNITTASTDQIVINFMAQTITLSGSNIYNTLALDDFWSLQPGDNEIVFKTANNADTATATIIWNSSYTGIL